VFAGVALGGQQFKGYRLRPSRKLMLSVNSKRSILRPKPYSLLSPKLHKRLPVAALFSLVGQGLLA
jgi:hypothetical protein